MEKRVRSERAKLVTDSVGDLTPLTRVQVICREGRLMNEKCDLREASTYF